MAMATKVFAYKSCCEQYLGLGICVKYFLSLSQKTLFLQLYQKKPFGTWQFGTFYVLANYLVSVFSGDRFFEGMRENILRIFRA